MTDRELLEKAATAAGIEVHWHQDGTAYADCRWEWNPLTDDGDALRLAVKLHIELEFDDHLVTTYADYDYPGYKVHTRIKDGEFDADPYAATRRAIVRAAASMAEGTQEGGAA